MQLVAFVALCALGLQILILYAGGLQIRLNMGWACNMTVQPVPFYVLPDSPYVLPDLQSGSDTAPILVTHIARVLPDLQSGSVEYEDL